MKKLLSAFLAAALIFSPVGNVVFQDHHTVEAKSYKSGKRSFSTNRSNTNSFFQNKRSNTTTNKSYTTPRKSGGFMKGLMYGGIAGLLFGGMFGNMGAFGSIFGMLINVLAIVVIISLIRNLFSAFSRRRHEDHNQWRR